MRPTYIILATTEHYCDGNKRLNRIQLYLTMGSFFAMADLCDSGPLRWRPFAMHVYDPFITTFHLICYMPRFVKKMETCKTKFQEKVKFRGNS